MRNELEVRALIRVLELRMSESKQRMARTKSKAKIAIELRKQQDYHTELVSLKWTLGEK